MASKMVVLVIAALLALGCNSNSQVRVLVASPELQASVSAATAFWTEAASKSFTADQISESDCYDQGLHAATLIRVSFGETAGASETTRHHGFCLDIVVNRAAFDAPGAHRNLMMAHEFGHALNPDHDHPCSDSDLAKCDAIMNHHVGHEACSTDTDVFWYQAGTGETMAHDVCVKDEE